MIDESESGEAYDKLANQRRRLVPKNSHQRSRQDPMNLELEAKLVRAVMAENLSFNRLAEQFGMRHSYLETTLRRLGLNRLVSKKSVALSRRRSRTVRVRKVLTH